MWFLYRRESEDDAVSWLSYHRTESADLLQKRHPAAFLLLSLIARRARYAEDPCQVTKLTFGQCFIGDWREAGLSSQKQYRIAKEVLQQGQFAAFQGTNKGTTATLLPTAFYSISNENLGRAEGQSKGKPRATKEQGNKETRKTTNISEEMVRIGAIFKRQPTTKWSAKEISAYKDLDLKEDEICLMEAFYAFPERDREPLWRRKKLETLLNNWAGEIDKAKEWSTKYGHKPKTIQTEMKGVMR